MFFFACSECSGAPVTTPPACGLTGIEDDRFLTLIPSPRLKLLGLVTGSKQLSLLKGAFLSTVPLAGFVFDDGTGQGQYVEPAPKITLPLLVGTTFKQLIVGTGAAASEWKMLTAPTTGDYILKVTGGNWSLVDAGQIPGLSDIGASTTIAPKGVVVAIVQTSTSGPAVYALQKLAIVNKRVLVGDTTGTAGYRVLLDTEALEHPIGKHTALQIRTLETLDNAGSPIVGGLEQALTSGASAITDATALIYSPAVKRLFKAPPHLYNYAGVAAPSASGTPTTSYVVLPGGHAAGASLAFNYPNVRIDCFIRFSLATANVSFALFRDGTQVFEWPLKAGQSANLTYIDKGVTLGAHTYDIRYKQGTAAVACAIVFSSLTIQTLP